MTSVVFASKAAAYPNESLNVRHCQSLPTGSGKRTSLIWPKTFYCEVPKVIFVRLVNCLQVRLQPTQMDHFAMPFSMGRLLSLLTNIRLARERDI
jgi:hypothetical protein